MSPTANPATFRLLFVCTGNTCRSPLAAAIARRELRNRGVGDVEVASAGIAAGVEAPASPGALRAARRHGLDLSGHRSDQLDRESVGAADLVLVMAESHAHRVTALGGGEKVAMLSAFADGDDGFDGPGVPDPFGGDDATYEETYRVLEDLVRRAIERLATTQAR